MKTNGKAIVIFALVAIMAALLCPACAQPLASKSVEKGMLQATNLLHPSNFIVVDANEEGSYTVTISEDNIVQDEQVAEGLSGAVAPEEAAELEAKAKDAGKWSLGAVKQEDVTVCYTESTSGGEETAAEIRKAKVIGFSNDGKSIELSFKGPSAADAATERPLPRSRDERHRQHHQAGALLAGRRGL